MKFNTDQIVCHKQESRSWLKSQSHKVYVEMKITNVGDGEGLLPLEQISIYLFVNFCFLSTFYRLILGSFQLLYISTRERHLMTIWMKPTEKYVIFTFNINTVKYYLNNNTIQYSYMKCIYNLIIIYMIPFHNQCKLLLCTSAGNQLHFHNRLIGYKRKMILIDFPIIIG